MADFIASNPIVKSFVAGSVSGTCSTILFQPLDLVKTRIQQNHHTLNNTTLVSTTTNHSVTCTAARPSIFSTLRIVIANESVTGLWKGITPSITRTVPGVGLYFASLHALKTTHLGSTAEKPSPMQAIYLGMTARTIAGCAMIPITVLKTRFESGHFNYTKMSSALIDIYSHEGLRGLSCGLVPTLARDAPYSGLYLMFYTQLKQIVKNNTFFSRISEDTEISNLKINGYIASLTHFSCGITAGLLASLVTHPADVVKTRMQLEPIKYPTVLRACKQILHSNGPNGFLAGLAPRMLRRTLMSALAWTVYEELMRQLGLKN